MQKATIESELNCKLLILIKTGKNRLLLLLLLLLLLFLYNI